MAKTILGLIFILFPYLLIPFTKSPRKTIIYLLFFSLSAYTTIALLLQAFNIFFYPMPITTLFILDIVFIYFLSKNIDFKLINIKKLDVYFLVVLMISFFTLYQVHYNYSGKINLATDFTLQYHEVKNFKYPYPYFSDEWYAILLINYTIKTGKLPLWDPMNNTFFYNFEILFHSLLAYLFSVLNLSPLFYYTILSIFLNSLIILLIYLFLRINGLENRISAIGALLALYITCGANLPGIWHLIPIHLSIIFFLIGACFLSLDLLKEAFLSLFISSLFYPPLILFNFISLIVKFFTSQIRNKIKTLILVSILLFFILFPFLKMIIFSKNWQDIILSKVFYSSFYGEQTITRISFYRIIPLPIIFLGLMGFLKISKKDLWFFFVFGVTLFFWYFYSLSSKRLIIGYERNVFFSAILFIIISGFGLENFKKYLKEKFGLSIIIRWTEIGILFLFLFLIPFYTERENWKYITIENKITGEIYYPKAPANNYLTEDDLRIFKNIKGKKFLSIPWKGTVLAVSTENFPLIAKEGNLVIGDPQILNKFLGANCEEKIDLAKELKIDYIYLFSFDCPDFEKIDESKEGLILYKVK